MPSQFLRILAVLAVFLVCWGCSGVSSSGWYKFRIMNRSGEDFADVAILWGPRNVRIGKVYANGNISYGHFTDRPPNKATVSWRTKGGVDHQVEVDVPQSGASKGDSPIFCFVIMPDHTVKLELFSKEEFYSHQKYMELARDGAPAYFAGVNNATNGRLTDVGVFFAAYDVAGAAVVDSGWDLYYGLPYPVTDKARVEWTTADGLKHEQVVEIQPHLPKDLNGICIGFIIDKNNQVHVKALPWDKRESWRHKDVQELLAE